MCLLRYIAVAQILLCSRGAVAAGFDCKKTTTERETLVCGDAELSKADFELSREYAKALARVSPESASWLRSDQRAWLRFIDAACPISKGDGEDGPKDALVCLEDMYTRRTSVLREAGAKLGRFQFIKRQTFQAIPLRPSCDDSYENTDQKGGMEQLSVSYPQIDNPPNAQTRQWNQIAETTATKLHDEPKTIVNGVKYQVITAGDNMISLMCSQSWCNGTRHGGGDIKGQTILLTPRPHALAASDLFGEGRNWRRKLRDLAVAAAKRTEQGASPDFPFDLFRSVAVEPSQWVLRTRGLAILTYGRDTFGLCGTCEVLLPWSDLRSILAHGPPVF